MLPINCQSSVNLWLENSAVEKGQITSLIPSLESLRLACVDWKLVAHEEYAYPWTTG